MQFNITTPEQLYRLTRGMLRAARCRPEDFACQMQMVAASMSIGHDPHTGSQGEMIAAPTPPGQGNNNRGDGGGGGGHIPGHHYQPPFNVGEQVGLWNQEPFGNLPHQTPGDSAGGDFGGGGNARSAYKNPNVTGVVDRFGNRLIENFWAPLGGFFSESGVTLTLDAFVPTRTQAQLLWDEVHPATNWTMQAAFPDPNIIGEGFVCNGTFDAAGALFDGYALRTDPAAAPDDVHFFRVDAGVETELAAGFANLAANPGFYYELIGIDGGVPGDFRVMVYAADGSTVLLMLQVNDTTHTAGRMGLTSLQTNMRVQDFSVVIGATTPPTAPQLLSATYEVATDTLTLTFDQAMDTALIAGAADISGENGVKDFTNNGSGVWNMPTEFADMCTLNAAAAGTFVTWTGTPAVFKSAGGLDADPFVMFPLTII